MSKKQLLIADLLILFMMMFGLDLLAMAKYHSPFISTRLFNPYQLSQLIYGWATLWITRRLLQLTIPEKKYSLLSIGIVGIFLGFAVCRYLLEEVLLYQLLGKHNYPETVTPAFYFLDNLYYALVYTSLAASVFFLDAYIKTNRNQLNLLERNKEAELAFLRSQINPHFLFNSLNNIYALSYKKSEKAPEAILKLSELTRYMLYEKKDRIPLNTEWEYLEHYIALQKMRYDREINLQLKVEGSPEQWLIPPYLLIAAVENIFKHADFSKDQVACILLKATAEQLTLRTENRISQQQKDQTGGIGLSNLRKRLEILYPGKHQLETKVNADRFYLTLMIQH